MNCKLDFDLSKRLCTAYGTPGPNGERYYVDVSVGAGAAMRRWYTTPAEAQRCNTLYKGLGYRTRLVAVVQLA